MDTKEKIEAELLKAMRAIDEAQHLAHELPEDEDHDSFISNLVDIKSRLKYFLNKSFDGLARERKLKG